MIGSDGRMCNPEATPDVFTLRAETPDVEALERLQRVVVEHIKRFAFRRTSAGPMDANELRPSTDR